jgi:hypothetical protein
MTSPQILTCNEDELDFRSSKHLNKMIWREGSALVPALIHTLFDCRRTEQRAKISVISARAKGVAAPDSFPPEAAKAHSGLGCPLSTEALSHPKPHPFQDRPTQGCQPTRATSEA